MRHGTRQRSRSPGRSGRSLADQSQVLVRGSQRESADQRPRDVGAAYCRAAQGGAQV